LLAVLGAALTVLWYSRDGIAGRLFAGSPPSAMPLEDAALPLVQDASSPLAEPDAAPLVIEDIGDAAPGDAGLEEEDDDDDEDDDLDASVIVGDAEVHRARLDAGARRIKRTTHPNGAKPPLKRRPRRPRTRRRWHG
jgi:hypothetical protein